MKKNKIKTLVVFLFLLFNIQSFSQGINERLSIVPECDTSKIYTDIGEVHYFGKNMDKAKAYPQLIASFKADKRCKVLWVSSKRYKRRAKIKLEELDEYVFEKKDNGFEKYPCFAFFIDQIKETFPDGHYFSSYKFPSMVEVYKYDNGNWIKLFNKNVASPADFGALQLEMIKNY